MQKRIRGDSSSGVGDSCDIRGTGDDPSRAAAFGLHLRERLLALKFQLAVLHGEE
jgi:hypothetical protein